VYCNAQTDRDFSTTTIAITTAIAIAITTITDGSQSTTLTILERKIRMQLGG
jgi:hypothetical protein